MLWCPPWHSHPHCKEGALFRIRLFAAIMTLPANDAFSLGLAHDQPRRSRTPSSPKILFSSPSPVRGMSARSRRKQQHSIRSESIEETDASLSPKPKSKHARTSSTPNGPAPPSGVHKPNATAIDWEVPRKALHSSIGTHPRASACVGD